MKIKLGVIGCGAIGEEVCLFVKDYLKDKVEISSLFDIKKEKAHYLGKILGSKVKVALSIEDVVKDADLILEAASWQVVDNVVKSACRYKKDVIILSVGGILERRDLLRLVEEKRINLYIPSGAIAGIDGISAHSLKEIKKCVLITSKPPRGFKGVDYIKKKKIAINRIKRKKIIFRGRAREAFKNFPQNINVASTILLSSNFSDLEVVIYIDPKLKRNTHKIVLESDIGTMEIKIESIPSLKNPKTSTLAILSTQALLKKITSFIKIGS